MRGCLISVSVVSREPNGTYDTRFLSEIVSMGLGIDPGKLVERLEVCVHELLREVPKTNTGVSVSHSVSIIP